MSDMLPVPHSRSMAATGALGIALVTGVVADVLLRTERPGINLWLLSMVVLILVFLLRQRYGVPRNRASLVLFLLSTVFLLSFAWRDAPALNLLAFLASLMFAGLAAWTTQGAAVLRASAFEYIGGLFRVGLGTMIGSLPLVLNDAAWSPLTPALKARRISRVGLGVLLAIPPVVVFGVLFASADPIFSRVSRQLFAFNVETVFSHVAVILAVSWGAAGYLRELTLPATSPLRARSGAPAVRLGHTEMMIVLGSVCFLFAVFVAIQAGALFGGDAFVLAQAGLTYAEYARQGFFQLAGAAALVLPMLLLLDWIGKRDTIREERRFRLWSGVLLALLVLVLASAIHRMRVYQESYGLTELRVYTVAFMLWLAPVILWFGVTVLKGQRHRFASGAVVLATGGILYLHLMNPDRFIAQANLERAVRGLPFDAAHAASLSDDAGPVLLASLDRLDPEAQCLVASRFNRVPDDWRSWNLARQRTRQLAAAHTPTIRQIMLTCSPPPSL